MPKAEQQEEHCGSACSQRDRAGWPGKSGSAPASGGTQVGENEKAQRPTGLNQTDGRETASRNRIIPIVALSRLGKRALIWIKWPEWSTELEYAYVFHVTSYFIRRHVSAIIPVAKTRPKKLRLVLGCGLFALSVLLKRVYVRVRRGEKIAFEEIHYAATGRLKRDLISDARRQIAEKWPGYESIDPVEDVWSLTKEAQEALIGLPMQKRVNHLLEKISGALVCDPKAASSEADFKRPLLPGGPGRKREATTKYSELFDHLRQRVKAEPGYEKITTERLVKDLSMGLEASSLTYFYEFLSGELERNHPNAHHAFLERLQQAETDLGFCMLLEKLKPKGVEGPDE